ncbi:electron carrier/ protein disulfide oxidoreductase [Anaeramoeba flamelloides]|uniref:Electron carrier/ protein disulfide oxidoreductase n=1 Tax=Anaeramoeba flamelloides TaxID=1746091 RepID=A0ABQ8XQ84_9EUKA|nr:electron carrier/ protein disulfide oxidoreductase [Anaeramoeba flamelloides]
MSKKPNLVVEVNQQKKSTDFGMFVESPLLEQMGLGVIPISLSGVVEEKEEKKEREVTKKPEYEIENINDPDVPVELLKLHFQDYHQLANDPKKIKKRKNNDDNSQTKKHNNGKSLKKKIPAKIIIKKKNLIKKIKKKKNSIKEKKEEIMASKSIGFMNKSKSTSKLIDDKKQMKVTEKDYKNNNINELVMSKNYHSTNDITQNFYGKKKNTQTNTGESHTETNNTNKKETNVKNKHKIVENTKKTDLKLQDINLNQKEKPKKITLMKELDDFKKFSQILEYPLAIEYFKDFLRNSGNAEMLIFYLNWIEFKKICTEKNFNHLCEFLIKNWFDETKIFNLNIEQELINNILKRNKESDFSIDMFNSIGDNIHKQFEMKYFPKFQKHRTFEKLLQTQSTTNEKLKQPLKIISYFKRQTATILNNNNLTKDKNTNLDICQDLNEQIIEILKLFYLKRIKIINQKKIFQSSLFRKFEKLTPSLTLKKINEMDTNYKKCFFINLYNLLFLHTWIINGTPTNDKTLHEFFNKNYYLIEEKKISLNIIKEQIFQMKYSKISNKNEKKKKSKKNKEKKKTQTEKLFASNYFFDNLDIRIHFALIDFGIDIYQLKTYYPESIEHELDNVAKNFLKNTIQIEKHNNLIIFPHLFNTYYQDFGTTNSEILLKIRNWLKIKDPIILYKYSFAIQQQQLILLLQF